MHIPTRPGVHLAILGNIKFEVSDRYTLHKIVGKGSYGAVAYVLWTCDHCTSIASVSFRAIMLFML